MKATRTMWPVITLMAIATVLPELFTGSTPLVAFFNPGTVVWLLIGYGLAVLLVRELAVRCGSGILGLFFMGMGYSILNEGLFAKTLIIDTALPVSQYDHYGYFAGISFPWMAGIGAWHAVASVTLPILITHRLFPEAAGRPWIKAKVGVSLAVLLMVFACLGFLGKNDKGIKGTPAELGILLFIMLVCFSLGAVLKRAITTAPVQSRVSPIFLGISVIIPFWGLVIVAAVKAPVALYFMILAAVIVLFGAILKRCQWDTLPTFLLFGLGWYLHNIIQAGLIVSLAMGNPALGLITIAVDAGVVVLLYRAIMSPKLVPETAECVK